MYSICLAFNPTSTLYHHRPSIHRLSCPLTLPPVWLPGSASDHFAVTVASAGFYAAALYITDRAPFGCAAKIDLTVNFKTKVSD